MVQTSKNCKGCGASYVPHNKKNDKNYCKECYDELFMINHESEKLLKKKEKGI